METFTQTLTSVEAAVVKDAVATKVYVAEKAPIVLNNIVDWIVTNPKKALAITFFIVGFIIGTLV